MRTVCFFCKSLLIYSGFIMLLKMNIQTVLLSDCLSTLGWFLFVQKPFLLLKFRRVVSLQGIGMMECWTVVLVVSQRCLKLFTPTWRSETNLTYMSLFCLLLYGVCQGSCFIHHFVFILLKREQSMGGDHCWTILTSTFSKWFETGSWNYYLRIVFWRSHLMFLW